MNKNIIYYGSKNNLPKVVKLRSGPLNLSYENGCIRQIKCGKTEVIRKIYFAIRDQNWNTIEGVINNEVINSRNNSFNLEFSSVHEENDIDFVFNCKISGKPNGSISFDIKGVSNSNFKRNRIGFCILHPIKECVGKEVRIIHPDSQSTEGIFPVEISPDQPFINIQKFIWWPAENLKAQISYEGDIFEMEDQRNWTDTSYKSYCTPLELPYPVEVNIEDTVHQNVRLEINDPSSEIMVSSEENIFTIESAGINYKLPEIGLGPTKDIKELSDSECKILNKLSLDFIRVDIDMDQIIDDDFLIHLSNASQLKLPIQLGMHFGKNPITKLKEKIKLFEEYHITKCIIFDKYSKSTSEQISTTIVPEIRKISAKVEIGIGTNVYFTELNRFTPSFENVDFTIYSVNPQVHANDNLTLIENLRAQSDTVYSCRKLADKLPVHISPITLKPRFNPDATGPDVTPPPGSLPPQVDQRQMSLFGAGWTLGSIQNLAYGQADSIAYYEPVGWKGVIQGDKPPENPEMFQASPGEVFPMYFVFYWVTKMKQHLLIKSESSNPLLFSGISFSTEEGISTLLCNHSKASIEIHIQSDNHFTKSIYLDERNVVDFMKQPDTLFQKNPENLPSGNIITLLPYGLSLLS